MEELFKRLNIEPKDMSLYKNAFSHSSYVNEHKAKNDYERLEFLGDAVLDLVVADYLYTHYKETEGEMTKVRASYVCENANYCYATGLGLSKYILVGHGEQKEGGNLKKAIVADIFEALMGAIYIDLGFSTVRNVILKVVVPYIENPNVTFFSDYKSSLQEYVQTEQKSLEYKLVNEEGPAHDKRFTVDVVIDSIVYGTGIGTSKKEAEQEAAKVALNKLAVK
ncbi:MAG: ribonuclease III [Mollicutes bacterium]|nr:ribonuclease III [Mollicutes bacterium]MDY5875522.1 ribonuclease III [Bacilli bacterium]